MAEKIKTTDADGNKTKVKLKVGTAPNGTVLLVDDSSSIRFLVGQTMNQLGFDFVEGGNGIEGLQALQELKQSNNAPKLIISDLHMPVMDGLDFIKNVRERDKKTPILMLSMEHRDEKIREGRLAGANGWAVKPIQHDKFVSAIRKLTRIR